MNVDFINAIIFTSTKGPARRNVMRLPFVKVLANDRAKNESTFEHIATMIPSRSITRTESTGSSPMANNVLLGTIT